MNRFALRFINAEHRVDEYGHTFVIGETVTYRHEGKSTAHLPLGDRWYPLLTDALRCGAGSHLMLVRLNGDIGCDCEPIPLALCAEEVRVLAIADIGTLLGEYACDLADTMVTRLGEVAPQVQEALVVQRHWLAGTATTAVRDAAETSVREVQVRRGAKRRTALGGVVSAFARDGSDSARGAIRAAQGIAESIDSAPYNAELMRRICALPQFAAFAPHEGADDAS